MRDYLDGKLIGLKLKVGRFLERMRDEERGDTNFVSIILIIVIVVGIATIFRKQLAIAVDQVMGQLTTFIGQTDTGAWKGN